MKLAIVNASHPEYNCHDSHLHNNTYEMAKTAGTLILRSAGEDLMREGLLRTPDRFARAMAHLLEGYDETPESVVGQGVFAAEGQGLVSVRHVEFYSLCEHHMLPFWGTASVAYYPQEKILGLSKIPRVLDVFARRLQVQERLTHQVADAIFQLIEPRAVMVQVKASHMCMMMRGVEKQHSDTVTEAHRNLDQLSPLEQERLFNAL
jgi:GTP cyclohydrolase I